MYEIDVTLNEPIEDVLVLQQGDKPIIELTVFDYDGTAWDTGYTGTFVIGRSGSDPDEWELAEVAGVPGTAVNVFYFQLESITNSRGDYQAFLLLVNAAETTPEATPEDVTYSFKPMKIEVV